MDDNTSAEFGCPSCTRGNLSQIRDGKRLECTRCGHQTHEKIVQNAGHLEKLVESDLPAARIAKLLLNGKEST